LPCALQGRAAGGSSKAPSRPTKRQDRRPSQPKVFPAAHAGRGGGARPAAAAGARGFAVGSIETKTGKARMVGGNKDSPVPCNNPTCGATSVCAYSHAGKAK
jgi:hypothetical protein